MTDFMEIIKVVEELNYQPFENQNEMIGIVKYIEEYGNIFSLNFDGYSIVVYAFDDIEIWDSENDQRLCDDENDVYTETFKECFIRRLKEKTGLLHQIALLY